MITQRKHLGRLPVALALASLAVIGSSVGLVTAGASPAGSSSGSGRLPVKQIERIEQAQGDVSGGVLSIDIDPSYSPVSLHKVTFKSGFQIQHQLYFQMLNSKTATFNGDVSVTPGEMQHVIATIQANHLTFQAEHQHFINIRPERWFVHFRGTGAPKVLAEEVHAVVEATKVKLPQTMPKHPTTPLPAKQLANILGGQATVGEHGIVDVEIDRTDSVKLGGHAIDPGLGVSTDVQFQPLGKHGRALAVPDFSLTSAEANPVVRVMQHLGWEVECLYNQEIGEHPQLFFSHMDKVGDARQLAQEIRAGLDKTAAQK
jgi:hypothetical protein